jgi:hypothetical protein
MLPCRHFIQACQRSSLIRTLRANTARDERSFSCTPVRVSQRKQVPPLRSLRFAPVGMTRFESGECWFQRNICRPCRVPSVSVRAARRESEGVQRSSMPSRRRASARFRARLYALRWFTIFLRWKTKSALTDIFCSAAGTRISRKVAASSVTVTRVFTGSGRNNPACSILRAT